MISRHIDLAKTRPYSGYDFGPCWRMKLPNKQVGCRIATLAPITKRDVKSNTYPLGVEILPGHLDAAAHDCAEAAYFRNVPLEAELKTLVFVRHERSRVFRDPEYYAFNLPGDRYVDLESLGLADARMATEIGFLTSGTINPFRIFDALPILRMFVCEYVLYSNRRFTTNDGTTTGTMILPASVFSKTFHNYSPFRSVAIQPHNGKMIR